jgi:putative ABC transport system permease protein
MAGESHKCGTITHEVSPTDASTFFVVAALLAVVALVASYVPARKAAGDPIVALRYE